RICQHIELEFNETMLHHERNAVERLNELKGIQTKEFLITDERRRQGFINSTRQPDKNLIGKWKNVLTVAEQEEFLELAGDLLSELGYDTGIYIPVH
ncbi:MAG: hypothetical protein RLZZ156_2770, partial [Deinococcota bacterium]